MKSTAKRRIIGKFSRGEHSPETVSVFRRWLSREALSGDGSDALMEVWDDCGNLPVENGLTENPFELISEIEGTGSAGNKKKVVRRMIVAVSLAASICVAVLCGYIAGTYSMPDRILASASHSKGYFVLPDSSKVWLNNDSRLYLSNRFFGRTRKVRLEGEAYFEVSRDEKHPFVVNTDKLDVTVLGTKFTVTSYSGKPNSVCLAEGSVKVTGPDVPATVLRPGELLTEACGYWKVKKVRTSIYTAWTGSQMKFDSIPLSDIAKSLEHWYNVRIALHNRELMDSITLSFTVRFEPLEEILQAIEVISGVHYRMLDSDLIELF
ncbi:MAG: FecR domain-containing protein [Bacteroidales bacterium]|nr:FecR domain-containing protein [Bacteroidales bacterium]